MSSSFTDVVARARAMGTGENVDGKRIDAPPSTSAATFMSARELDVLTELSQQADDRRKGSLQTRGKISEEDVKRGGETKSRDAWRKALRSIRNAKASAALTDVSAVDWTDVDGLFAYYDAVYFENSLCGRVTFSWHASSADGHPDEGEDEMGEHAKLERLFKYCLCSDVPKWWHGASPNQLSAGLCCVVERRGAQYTRAAHIRMPDVLRRFKMTQMTKEALLHSMAHAFLFLNGHTKEDQAFNAHDEAFKQLIYKLNYDFITPDVYRPPDKGYQIRWFDRLVTTEHAAASTNDNTLVRDTMAKSSSMVDTLTPEHYKLLYFISKHSRLAEKATDSERWIRYLEVMVLVYEAVVQGVFDYDYAPFVEQVANKRMMLNVSQEARDNLDDLVEAGMLRSLRLSSLGGKSTMAYQPSKKGLEHMRRGYMSKEDKELCDEFLFDPKGSLFRVVFDDKTETFKLSSDQGYNIDSSVTASEDVSYVCSPYICRQFMKGAPAPLASYAYRASESLRGLSSIADDLDVQLSMSRVIMLIGDWIPTSCTQITELSQSLGVEERNQGGYHCTDIDRASTDTVLEVPTGLTRITIASSNPAQFCNMEAQVEYPEVAGITQFESFGIRYAREGDVICGIKVESCMTKILNDIPVDFLSRIAADVQVDSSKLTTSLMSPYQRNLLETVYDSRAVDREKFTLFMAETITPKLSARHYLDGDSIEAEIRQLIGDTQYALDVTDADVVIIGSGGIVFAGPECSRHESLLMAFCQLRTRENFCNVLYGELMKMKESERNLQKMLERVYDEPECLRQAQVQLSETSTNLYRLGEAIRHMKMASETPLIVFGDAKEPETPMVTTAMYYALDTKSSKRLYHALRVGALEATISKRINGCVKHYKMNEDFLHVLQKQANEVMRANKTKSILKTKSTLEKVSELMERDGGGDGQSYRMLSSLYLGLFACRAFDRLIGTSWSVSESVSFITNHVRYPLMWRTSVPWVLISLLLWFVLFGVCVFLKSVHVDRSEGFVESTTTSMQRKLCVNTFLRYLKLKQEVGRQEIVASDPAATQMTRITYVETSRGRVFRGYDARVTLTVDTKRGYLFKSQIRIAKSKSIPAKLFPNDLHSMLMTDLELNGVIVDGDVVQKLREQQAKTKPTTLLVQAAGETHTREVLITVGTVRHLYEQIASKFCYRFKNVIRVTRLTQVDATTVDEDLIETDSQVVALRDFQRLVVVFYGKPKPKMARYIRQVKDRAARKEDLMERFMIFKRKLKATRNATVQEVFPETDDEHDEGF